MYALAIAHLLSTVARLIGARERVRFSWFHAYWMLNALIVLVVNWISWWERARRPKLADDQHLRRAGAVLR